VRGRERQQVGLGLRRNGALVFVADFHAGGLHGDRGDVTAAGAFDLLAGQVVLHGELFLARRASDGDHGVPRSLKRAGVRPATTNLGQSHRMTS
jgi:hypothetical protein